MRRIMMIVVVVAVAIGFAPVSGFAQKNFNSSKSNTSTSIATSKTQADCKNAGGVWGVDVRGKGVCMTRNYAARNTIGFKAEDNLKKKCRRCLRNCTGKCTTSCFCYETLPPMRPPRL
ncbi:MAG: hypothetical protein Q9M25_05075 [Mariprofundaceae bacterium]|nr:hypothetical protein [Mariprofundaceae bacterium]